jgi:hypothetical protein
MGFCSEGPRPIATLTTTNPTWPDLGSNPVRRGAVAVTLWDSVREVPGWNLISILTTDFRDYPQSALSNVQIFRWSILLSSRSLSSDHFNYCDV